MSDRIAFNDLEAQRIRLGDRIAKAIEGVLAHGQYIMGPEVGILESELSDFCSVRHTITCANGTDALTMILMAYDIGPGDAVFVPSFTFIATAEAVLLVGATPVFVDVQAETFNFDVAHLEAAVTEAERLGLRPRAVIPVDLFGQPADYPAIGAVAESRGLVLIADAAQSFGGRLGNRRVGSFGDVTATSFFPAKPLGCYGDGGAVFTNDDALAERLRSIRFHGKGENKYDNVRVGMNSRLDTMQAAILLAKLSIFADELVARQRVADRYSAALAEFATVPHFVPGAASAWAQYTLQVDRRDAVIAACHAEGVPVQVYYPIPMHRQSGYAHLPVAPGGCPVAERLAASVVSLPMHPYLDESTQDRVIAAVRRSLSRRAKLRPDL